MWFRNLVLFRLAHPLRASAGEISSALAAHSFQPCGGLDPWSAGWEPPLGRDATDLVHAAAGCVLLSLCREERLLPPAVVNDAAAERIDAIERDEGRAVRARERKRIKDDVFFTLLPRAFTRRARTFAYLAPERGWLVVDAASAKRAEELVSLLVHSVRGLEIEPWVAATAPAPLMTEWVARGAAPGGLTLGDECELRERAEDGAVVRCLRQDLASAEIEAHLKAGKQVSRLALGFRERLAFVLGADLSVRRLRFEAVDEIDEMEEADAATRLDANFAFMTAELAPLLELLAETFGGA